MWDLVLWVKRKLVACSREALAAVVAEACREGLKVVRMTGTLKERAS
jgi:hypothetical protein